MSTLKLFKKAFAGKDIAFRTINELAITRGYLVSPDCCTKEVYDWLQSLPQNLNSTFYKNWNDIITKNRFEIYLDQIQSYIATYVMGQAWTPNNGSEQPMYEDLKVIDVISYNEAGERCAKMLYSGIALAQDTLDSIFSILEVVGYPYVVADLVKNKEAKMIFCDRAGVLPTDATEFVRFLIYKANGKTLLIKDKATINALKVSNLEFTAYANKFGINKLASVFHRYKPLFLALKGNKSNSKTVNTLRRLAETEHKPFKSGYFENLLSNPKLLPQLEDKLAECNNFKKINLLQTILIRQKQLDMRFFAVRNGKIWAKVEKTNSKNYYEIVYNIIYKSLIKSLSEKATSVKLPTGVSIALPTSEKTFIGDYPLGTAFDISDTDTIIGINWNESGGARDLDFRLCDHTGTHYGWNASFKSIKGDVVYSGDVTYPNPEATELFYIKNGIGEDFRGLVTINLFSGEDNSTFHFFLAQENVSYNVQNNQLRNYMVNPNNVKVMVESKMESKEKILGVIAKNKFILAQFRTGNRTVGKTDITTSYREHVFNTLDCYLSLEKVLHDAGFQINTGEEKLDFTNSSKDSLLTLLA